MTTFKSTFDINTFNEPRPTPSRGTGVWALFSSLAHVIVEADKAEGNQQNIQAVSRLDSELLRLKNEGLLTRFNIGGWRGDTIHVAAVMPDERYIRDNRLLVHERLEHSLEGLNLFVEVDLTTDYGESA